MKMFFLGLSILFSNLIYSQIPNLVSRTLEMKLNENDFETKNKYMVNVDTVDIYRETISGEITWFSNKTEMINKINQVIKVVKDKNIGRFVELKNTPSYFSRRLHWYMEIEDYRIDWWFANSDIAKLETITLVKK